MVDELSVTDQGQLDLFGLSGSSPDDPGSTAARSGRAGP
jgi:hypothetical protein